MPKKFRRIMDSASGSPTFIGEGTKFHGNFGGNGNFVICGSVEGDCELEGPVSIAASGHWKGKISATDVVIAGKVDGDVLARGKLELAPTARVAGSISGRSIAVAEGAVIEGEIRVQSSDDVKKFTEKRKEEHEH